VAGYTDTPLHQKLGFRPGDRVYLKNAPDAYQEWLDPLPEGVHFLQRLVGQVDVAHVFSTQRAELKATVPKVLEKLAPGGCLWISWPKKASGVPSEITEDTVRAIALPQGLVDVKVCAVNDVWSGLKLVRRRRRP
jgi:hypothetical protein